MSYCINGTPLRVRLIMCVVWYAALDWLKMVTSKFKSGGLHEKHVVAT